MIKPRIWETYSHEYSQGFTHFGTQAKLKFYDSKNDSVAVRLIEDPEGNYMGWIPTGQTEPIMVIRKHIFDIQFPDGHKANERDGKGLAISLRVEKI